MTFIQAELGYYNQYNICSLLIILSTVPALYRATYVKQPTPCTVALFGRCALMWIALHVQTVFRNVGCISSGRGWLHVRHRRMGASFAPRRHWPAEGPSELPYTRHAFVVVQLAASKPLTKA
jgi:hypothetical protein